MHNRQTMSTCRKCSIDIVQESFSQWLHVLFITIVCYKTMRFFTIYIYKDIFSTSNLALSSMFVILKNSFTWNKVFWLCVGNLSLDPLQTCVCLFIDLGVYCCYIWSCVLVQRIATRAPNTTMPVNKKVVKMGWLAVKDVLMELPTVIIYYYGSWRLLKASEKDLKRMLCGLVGSRDFKPVAYCMWAVDCENAWC